MVLSTIKKYLNDKSKIIGQMKQGTRDKYMIACLINLSGNI